MSSPNAITHAQNQRQTTGIHVFATPPTTDGSCIFDYQPFAIVRPRHSDHIESTERYGPYTTANLFARRDTTTIGGLPVDDEQLLFGRRGLYAFEHADYEAQRDIDAAKQQVPRDECKCVARNG